MANQEYFELTDSAQAPVRDHKTGDKAMVINGSEVALVDQDSVQAAADARIEELRGWIAGRQTYETLAAAQAAGEPANGEAVVVWNDPDPANNGVWGWSESQLVQSDYDMKKYVDNKIQRSENRSGWAMAIADDNDRVLIGIRDNGDVWLGKIKDLAGAISQLIDIVSTVPGIDGMSAIITDGERVGLTLSKTGDVKIRGVWIGQVMQQLRATQKNLVNVCGVSGIKEIVCIGDSLTQGTGASAGNDYPSQLSRLLDERVSNMGLGGQTSEQICARVGSFCGLFEIDGEEISAVGATTLKGGHNEPYTYAGGYASGYGYLGGVFGQLNGGNPYTFTRASAGVAIKINGSLPFIPRFRYVMRRTFCVFWIGRNDVPAVDSDPDALWRVRDRITDIVTDMSPARSFLILGLLPADTEVVGSARHTAITSFNTYMAQRFSAHFVDVLAILQSAGDGSSDDVLDVDNGVVPGSLRSDAVHLNDAGYSIVASAVKDKKSELGVCYA